MKLLYILLATVVAITISRLFDYIFDKFVETNKMKMTIDERTRVSILIHFVVFVIIYVAVILSTT
mgnify:CR=1 FL=1